MAENKGINALPMKAKVALLALCPLVIIVLCSVVIVLYAGSLVEEGTYNPQPEPPVYLSQVPESDEDRIAAVNTLLQAAQTGNETQITVETTVDLHDLTSNLTEAQKNLFVFASGSVEGGMAGFANRKGLSYGESADLFAPIASDNIELTQEELFTYTADIENPFAEEDGQVFTQTQDAFVNVLTVIDKKITPATSNVQLLLDPVTDRLREVTYSRTYNMDYTVEFVGELADLGTQNLQFGCTLTDKYTITWAGISIEQNLISLAKNGYQALSTTIHKAEDATPEDYKLTYTSSDESVATVDEKGFVEAVAVSDTLVTITATMEYLGKTYTDSCEVLVIVPPESVKMHSKAQTVKIGESVQLSASVQPEKASIKTIIWYSPDESVATVDENGVVTAVGEGEVQIIAVSEIGTYMAGCTITVEGGVD